MFKVLGVALLVIALAIAIVPNFTDCQSQGKVITMASGKTTAMKCHWSGKAELALALPIFAVGAMMTFSRRKSFMNLSIVGLVLGFGVLAVPTESVIGVCGTPGMICNSVMKPSLMSLGAVVMGIGLVGAVISRKKEV